VVNVVLVCSGILEQCTDDTISSFGGGQLPFLLQLLLLGQWVDMIIDLAFFFVWKEKVYFLHAVVEEKSLSPWPWFIGHSYQTAPILDRENFNCRVVDVQRSISFKNSLGYHPTFLIFFWTSFVVVVEFVALFGWTDRRHM